MVDNFCGFLDDSFDVDFGPLNLSWLPWVGIGFRDTQTRTIILGESVYVYGDGSETVRNRILKKDSLRQRHMTHGILAKFKSRYLRNFERAVFLKKLPSGVDRKLLWSQVIYHNLVPRLLESRKNRPTPDDYTAGWKVFLELAKVVRAQRCIVYGVEKMKIDSLLHLLKFPGSPYEVIKQRWLPAIGCNRPLALSFLLEGIQVDLLFMRHPSSFFSWDKWGTVLREAGMMPVALMGADHSHADCLDNPVQAIESSAETT